jgi:diguanylate cyclase (GGDEF)-like protein
VRATKILLDGQPAMLSLCRDISAQKKAQARIEFLAFHDDLTGLPNRVLGQYRLLQAIDLAQRRHTGLAVLYLDLDRFKHVNDTHGHAAGDRLLKGVAERLGRDLSAADCLCRLSADEFMLVLPERATGQPASAVTTACEQLLATLAPPFDIQGREIHASLSIGVALYPQDGADAETLMRNADTALYEAKHTGRQTYRFFEARMNDELTRFIQTRDALREALERREFVLHYQPQLDLRSGMVVGVEALVRWQRPGVGLLAPGAFIDVAEESGLIVPLGRWVLEEACRQAAAWRASHWPHLVMAVNLSALQFRDRELGAQVLDTLAASGLEPGGLDLELTESLLLQGEEGVLATLLEWKARGIQLSIDDFGTGYSSLAYLKRFKVDKLKIDRAFVNQLLTVGEDRAIVLAMIQIARSLNLKTLAEGVEEEAQAEQLKVMGCDGVQGYLYSRPLPAADLTRWLEERSGLGR